MEVSFICVNKTKHRLLPLQNTLQLLITTKIDPTKMTLSRVKLKDTSA